LLREERVNDEFMFEALSSAKLSLAALMGERGRWSSLIVNRRKPWTYRAFTNFEFQGEKLRVCLHRFTTCEESESFLHPHPWPGAFELLNGYYAMNIGASPDRFSKPKATLKVVLGPRSKYAITSPLTWHSVTPLMECYTIMVNGAPWDPETVAHTEIRTTKGKDLDSMSDEDLSKHFAAFQNLTWWGK
jgi:hypothetical protein